MSDDLTKAAYPTAPQGGVAFPLGPDRLAGTGTTEDHNTTALNVGQFATLMVGDTAVRVSFRSATGGSGQVATTDMIIAANKDFPWLVFDATKVVYIEAADGSSAYEAWLWQSNP